MNTFFLAGLGVGIFVELLLISKRDKSAADWILTTWMLLIIAHLGAFSLFFTGSIYDFPFLLGLEQPFPLLHGVFLYLYVGSLTNQLPENRLILILHFIPAGVLYLILSPFLFLSGEEKIQIYKSHGAGYEWIDPIKSVAITISGIAYVSWSAVLLRKHQENIRDQFSDLDRVNLRWLQVLTFGLGAIWILVVAIRNDVLVFVGVVVFVFAFGFFGVRQAEIFTRGTAVSGGDDPKKKYTKSGLTEETSGELHGELRRLMADEALYKKSDLSINDLSSRLGVHPNHLSQVINQKEKKHFYDFVNTYRIEEFKRLVATPKGRQYTLISLAFDCGFSSKTAFNRYFKKVTGQTPSEFSTALSGAGKPSS